MSELIDRQAAIDAIEEYADRLQMVDWKENPGVPYKAYALNWCINTIRDLPSAQPEPLSDAYTKAVWTWLLEYQIKAAELKGRYTPYEVLSWVANDWRKEHEGSD